MFDDNNKLVDIIGKPRGHLERQNIYQQADSLRVKLSSNKEISINIEEYDETITVTREQYNDAIKELLKPFESELIEIKKGMSENSMTFLIGGLSYTPIIKEIVTKTIGEYSIRITGDEFLMESARMLILLENMNEPHLKLNDILPYPVTISFNNKHEEFIKKKMIMNYELAIELPKTNQILLTQVNKYTNKVKIVREFKVNATNEKNIAKFTIVPLEKGIINEINIDKENYSKELPFNKTVINEQLANHITKKVQEEEEKNRLYTITRNYQQLLKDLEEVLTNEELEKAYGFPASMLKNNEELTREQLVQISSSIKEANL